MKQICVFCGSSPGAKPDYIQAAKSLGLLLAEKKVTLVYGGASVGLMGQLAKTCLDAGGEVIGVIPRKLVELEVAYGKLTQLHIVETMHERKAMMSKLSDGFIALPGGLGTIEEFFEVLTWAQLGMHQKPCGLLNVGGYYDRLIEFLDHAVAQHFIESTHRDMIQIDEKPEGLLEIFEVYHAPLSSKAAWVLKMTSRLAAD
jgi:uncharacterized protein (TIGR00730 family)